MEQPVALFQETTQATPGVTTHISNSCPTNTAARGLHLTIPQTNKWFQINKKWQPKITRNNSNTRWLKIQRSKRPWRIKHTCRPSKSHVRMPRWELTQGNKQGHRGYRATPQTLILRQFPHDFQIIWSTKTLNQLRRKKTIATWMRQESEARQEQNL